jgi:hypothetical protein
VAGGLHTGGRGSWRLRWGRRFRPRWRLALLILLCAGLTVTLWERRGVLAGLVAFAAYGLLVALDLYRRGTGAGWFGRATGLTRRHPVMDAVLGPVWVGALAFCAIALVSDRPLRGCLVLAAWVAGPLMVVLLVSHWLRVRQVSS